jgi:hypothetical protein
MSGSVTPGTEGNSLRAARYLPVLARGRPLHGPERYAPFFIVGSGRCGSTLLRALLEAHQDIHIPPGNPVLRAVIREYRWYSRLPWSVVLRLVLGRMTFHPSWEAYDLSLGQVFRDLVAQPREQRDLAAVLNAVYRAHLSKHKPGARIWGDKSPLAVVALKEIRAVFPDVRVIHMLRDGRDVAASFAGAFADDIARATMVWRRAVRAAHAFRERAPEQFLEVRYEELVRAPEPVLRRVAGFVGVAFDERMLRHHELDLRLGDVERIPYMQGVQRAVHQESIGRWRTTFGPQERAELERRLQPTLRQIGYDGDAGEAP